MGLHQKNCIRLSIFAIILCALPGNVWALANSTGANGSNAQAVHALGETGPGVNIGLVSTGNVLTTHEAFDDGSGSPRTFNIDIGSGIEITSHDTQAAGIAISAGSATYPEDVGVAPGANIYSTKVYFTSDIETAIDELITGLSDCRVILTVIHDPVNPADGTNQAWTLVYDYYAYWHDNVLFANAAGNYETSITIGGDAYNGVTTGGLRLNDIDEYNRVGWGSNPGPTIDGRDKPEIVAPAESQHLPYSSGNTAWLTVGTTAGQTSYSTPHTAGVAALLLGLADSTPEANDDKNVVLKAVMINSTYPNINDENENPTTGLLWHSQRGYGRLDALRAYELLNAGKILKEVAVNQPKGWAYASMTQDYQNDTYLITGKKNQMLVLTATWNRKITKSGSNYTAETGFNIDVSVKDPLGSAVFSETDTLNNLEKAELLLGRDGVYEINIENKTTIDRDYGFAFELIDPLIGDFEPINHSVDLDDLVRLAADWGSTGSGLETDIKPDEVIDYLDFAIFAQNWLEINPAYYIP